MARAIICILLIFSFFAGCSRKPKEPQQEPESSSIELTLPQIPKLSGPYKPTDKDIQIALQKAGFYKEEIDGIIGPQTREAIKEFQAENNLVVDGKVGPKTWAVLSKYLLTSKETNFRQ
ncbi:MAG: peptidoglycan-binding domain-containing protein [Candidatus Omnitrophota bacterium]